MPSLNTEDPFAGDDSSARSTSAVYTRYFLDAVNAQSVGRWSVQDSSGNKTFALSNTAYTAPKAWVMGGTYWNREDDTLTTNTFVIPGTTANNKLSFYSRWQIATGDSAEVQFSADGTNWIDVASFTGGQNPSYPNWDKYLFFLPDSPTDRNAKVRVHFTSNTSGTGWGFGLDSVAVYQTQLDPPTGLTAKSAAGGVNLNWDPTYTGTRPATYTIERSTDPEGPFTQVGSVDYPLHAYSDTTASAGVNYFYQLRASRDGFSSTPVSADTSGAAQWNAGSWVATAVPNTAGSNDPSLAVWGTGNPGIVFQAANGVQYTWANTSTPSLPADWFSNTVSTGAAYGYSQAVLVPVQGQPGAAYVENHDPADFSGTDTIKYASNSAADGSGLWQEQHSFDAGTFTWGLTGTVVGNYPALAWCVQGDDPLFGTNAASSIASDVAGTTWSDGPLGSFFWAQSAAVGSANGHLVFAAATEDSSDPDFITHSLEFVDATNTFHYLSENAYTGSDLDLMDVGGRTILFYKDLYKQDVRALRSADADATSFEARKVLGIYHVQKFSAARIGGLPAIAWYDGNTSIWYQRATDAALTSWEPPQLVATGAANGAYAVGDGPWLAEYNGEPYLIFYGQNGLILARHTP